MDPSLDDELSPRASESDWTPNSFEVRKVDLEQAQLELVDRAVRQASPPAETLQLGGGGARGSNDPRGSGGTEVEGGGMDGSASPERRRAAGRVGVRLVLPGEGDFAGPRSRTAVQQRKLQEELAAFLTTVTPVTYLQV